MIVHGYAWVNPEMHYMVRVYCDSPGPFHEKYGRTWLATFARPIPEDAGWREVQPTSRRVKRQNDAYIRGSEDGIHFPGENPFPGQINPGIRPPALTYLRGDTPAAPNDQHHIAEALSTGRRNSSRGLEEARAEDLAGRAKLDIRRCRCGEPPLRERGEVIWPIFDLVVEHQKHQQISTRTLRHAIERAKRT